MTAILPSSSQTADPEPGLDRKALGRQVAIANNGPYADFYGYIGVPEGETVGTQKIKVHFALGNGGNKVYIAPSPRMVIAITSRVDDHGCGQRRSQDILLKILERRAQK